jgi:hypothetical protein
MCSECRGGSAATTGCVLHLQANIMIHKNITIAKKDHSHTTPHGVESSKLCGFTSSMLSQFRKHMDKNQRPYKCNLKSCEKLKGFARMAVPLGVSLSARTHSVFPRSSMGDS